MFVPNLDTLRSNFSSFASRGTAPSAQFAQRFGGYQGTPFVAQQFRGEPDEGFRSAIPDSRKFAQAFEDYAEEPKAPPPAPTYTPPPPPEPTVSTVPQSFFSNLTASQSYAQRTESDASIQNAAAALDPTRIQSILDAARNASGFTGLTSGISPIMFKTREDVVPLNEPEMGRNIFNYEDTGYNFPVVPEPVVEPPPEPVPPPYNPPPVYIPPPPPPYQPQPTYSRAQQDDEEDDEEIESIDVVGRSRPMDDEVIDSIDVRGRNRENEELDSIDVGGKTRDYLDEARQEQQQQQQYAYGGDNPWENFKAMYVDFMTGGQGGAVLQDFNMREAKGEFDSRYKTAGEQFKSQLLEQDKLYQKNFQPMNNVSKDTNEILRAKSEKDQLMDTASMSRESRQETSGGTTVINNSQTIATSKPADGTKTSRVFSDDSTFNRHAAADIFHPKY